MTDINDIIELTRRLGGDLAAVAAILNDSEALERLEVYDQTLIDAAVAQVGEWFEAGYTSLANVPH